MAYIFRVHSVGPFYKSIAICLLGIAGIGQGRGDVVVYDNIAPSGSTGGYGWNGTTTSVGQRFNTSVAGGINFIRLNLYRNLSSATSAYFRVQLWRDNVNVPMHRNVDPNARLATLYEGNVSSLQVYGGSDTLPTGISPITINSSQFLNQYQMTAGTNYWLVIDSSSDPNDLMWGWGPNNVSPNANAISENNGFTWLPRNFTYDMGALISVPEPGTFILASIASVSAGAGVFLRRRKKHLQDKSITETNLNPNPEQVIIT